MPEPPDSDHGLDELDAFARGEGGTQLPSEEPRADDLDVFAGGGTAELPAHEAATPPGPPTAGLPTLPEEFGFGAGPPTIGCEQHQVEGIPEELLDHPRYRIVRLLGAGGMGSVYQAEHRLMGRPVALKVILRELTASANASQRFEREVRTAAQLHHPNIVASYDAEQAGELHFLAMEYVEGGSLGEYVRRAGPLPLAEACDCIRQAALGLQYAHEKGMVHRDIKPDNLMRTPAGQVKILDFGIARFAHRQVEEAAQGGPAPEGGSLTLAGSIMGTPDYMAPEQGHDSSTVDTRADVYALGCTLYYLLTGQVPFPTGTAVQKVMAHLEETAKPVRELRPEVPATLAAVVEKMMARDPADRYQTPGEVAVALEPFLARPANPPRRAVWVAVGLIAVGLFAALWLPGSKEGTLPLYPVGNVLAFLVAVAIAGTGGWLWLRQRKR